MKLTLLLLLISFYLYESKDCEEGESYNLDDCKNRAISESEGYCCYGENNDGSKRCVELGEISDESYNEYIQWDGDLSKIIYASKGGDPCDMKQKFVIVIKN